jgi:hypothetical protein
MRKSADNDNVRRRRNKITQVSSIVSQVHGRYADNKCINSISTHTTVMHTTNRL